MSTLEEHGHKPTFTPAMSDIRSAYVKQHPEVVRLMRGAWPETDVVDAMALAGDQFDRAMEQHDADAKAGALDDASRVWAGSAWQDSFAAAGVGDDISAVRATVVWFKDRASAIREKAGLQ